MGSHERHLPDFKSDVYCYAHVDGTWTTHVAGNRVVGQVPHVRWAEFLSDKITAEEIAADSAAQHAYLDGAEREPITLPHVGETFKDASPAEMKATLLRLRSLGYHVPAHALTELDEEIADAQPSPTRSPT